MQNSKRNVRRSGKTCSRAMAYGVKRCAEMLIRVFVVLVIDVGWLVMDTFVEHVSHENDENRDVRNLPLDF
jgi:hypothetical protein